MFKLPIVRRVLLACALAVSGVSAPIFLGATTPAMAQTADDMQEALDNYGHWVRLAPYGEVWVPDGVPRDWQPYEYGHWVYTDDWGWYWVSDPAEDDWGWVVFHYGRWVHDRGSWFWVPGDEWAPAWVDWRYGGDTIGWAPLPPDDLIDAYDAQPDDWLFVPLRYIGEPRLRTHFLPRDRRAFMLRDTHVINRPVHVEGRRLWVNPGLAPAFIAGRTHVALHAYNVRPRVFGATTGVQGAVAVRKQDLRIKGAVKRAAPITIQRTTAVINPGAAMPAPKPLGKGEHGQLGSHPPRAAQGTGTGAPPPKTPAVTTPTTPRPTMPTVTPVQPKPSGTPQIGNPPAIHQGNPPPQAQPVHPAPPPPPPPPPKQPSVTPPPPHAPPAMGAPSPPVTRAPPPPVVHAPPPPVVHAPPPPPKAPPPRPPEAKRPPPKPGDKNPEPQK